MRVLIIGSDHQWRMERATERALNRAGHKTLLIDDRRAKRLLGWKLTQRWALFNAKRFRPDFVFLSKCLALDPETVRGIIAGKPNAMWYHDPQWFRDTVRPDIGHIVSIGKLSQTFFVSGFDAEWRALGLPAKYLPAAGDASIKPVPFETRYAADVTFIGTGYDPARSAILLEVAKTHDVRVWGLGWEKWREPLKWTGKPVEGRQFATVCSSSKITLGINPAIAKGGSNYTSDRTWMVILAGAFYLGQGTPGMREMLHDGEHCAWYEDAADCVAQCDRYLAHERAREKIRAEGERFVRANHTYDSRIANLLSGEAWTNSLSRA
ncbi:MAG: glycosyltransferase [Gemmatimonadota bacterium]|nr:glycosyltransferase [Gemmatimonadota bacterium]